MRYVYDRGKGREPKVYCGRQYWTDDGVCTECSRPEHHPPPCRFDLHVKMVATSWLEDG